MVGYSLECEKSFRPPLQANALKRSEIVAGREAEAKVNENVECFATVTKKNKTAVAL